MRSDYHFLFFYVKSFWACESINLAEDHNWLLFLVYKVFGEGIADNWASLVSPFKTRRGKYVWDGGRDRNSLSKWYLADNEVGKSKVSYPSSSSSFLCSLLCLCLAGSSCGTFICLMPYLEFELLATFFFHYFCYNADVVFICVFSFWLPYWTIDITIYLELIFYQDIKSDLLWKFYIEYCLTMGRLCFPSVVDSNCLLSHLPCFCIL